MAHASSPTARILSLQAPLLSLAYSLTGERNDAYNLLRETTERAMATPDAFPTRDALFSAMRSIFASAYSSRARQRRATVGSRQYLLPDVVSVEVDIDAIPEGCIAPERLSSVLGSISDSRHSHALTLRALGYRYSDIARIEGISILKARFRVAMASISFRAILAL